MSATVIEGLEDGSDRVGIVHRPRQVSGALLVAAVEGVNGMVKFRPHSFAVVDQRRCARPGKWTLGGLVLGVVPTLVLIPLLLLLLLLAAIDAWRHT